MPKQIIKNVASQIGLLAGETLETVKKQPGEMAGKVLEQMGVSAGNPQTSQPTASQTDEAAAKARLGEMKAREAAQSQQAAAQISHQIEQEIEQLRKAREEQLRQRRAAAPAPAPVQEAVVAPTSKPGRQFGGGRRIKSAQEQAQPETAGRRVGG